VRGHISGATSPETNAPALDRACRLGILGTRGFVEAGVSSPSKIRVGLYLLGISAHESSSAHSNQVLCNGRSVQAQHTLYLSRPSEHLRPFHSVAYWCLIVQQRINILIFRFNSRFRFLLHYRKILGGKMGFYQRHPVVKGAEEAEGKNNATQGGQCV
jgi:hypothetical protein